MDHTDQLIVFLSNLSRFSENPASVRLVQTHTSMISIGPEIVYKVKKPVNFGFLDFSTLAKRKFYCEEEVRLNRRLTDGMYLGTVPIYQDGKGFGFDKKGPIIEYAVKMKRLSPQGFLINQIESPGFPLSSIDRLVERLHRFYNEQKPDPNVTRWGDFQTVRYTIEENIERRSPFVGKTLPILTAKFLETYQKEFLHQNQILFEKRVKENKIKDCHGDLHLEHIHIEKGKLSIYDCIEFNERIRCTDILNEVAFLAMDLDYRHRHDLSSYFIQQILNKEDDTSSPKLLDFYKVHRACVRGMVDSLTASESEVPIEERREETQKAKRYFELALRYAILGSQSTIIVVHGGVATGKSFQAEALANQLGIIHLNSDVIRKSIGQIKVSKRPSAETRKRLYTEEMTRRTYSELVSQGLARIKTDGCVILDARFSEEYQLKMLKREADQKGIQLILVETTAPIELVKKRLAQREDQPGLISDARLEDLDKLSDKTESSFLEKVGKTIKLNTAQNIESEKKKFFLDLISWDDKYSLLK